MCSVLQVYSAQCTLLHYTTSLLAPARAGSYLKRKPYCVILTHYTAQWTLHTRHYTLNSTHYTLHTTHCTLHGTINTIHYTLNSTHWKLHIKHYTSILHNTHLRVHTITTHYLLQAPAGAGSYLTKILDWGILTPYNTLHTTHYTLHTTHYTKNAILHHSILHQGHHPPWLGYRRVGWPPAITAE